MAKTFRVGLTRDILNSRSEPAFGKAALGILDNAVDLEWDYLPAVVPEITADHAAQYDAIYVNIPRVPAAAVARDDCRLRVIARHGVGYDSVDVAAMTCAGVVVTHTPSSMPRPVATIAVTFVVALAGKLLLKGIDGGNLVHIRREESQLRRCRSRLLGRADLRGSRMSGAVRGVRSWCWCGSDWSVRFCWRRCST